MLLHDDSAPAVEIRDQTYILGTYARTPFHPRRGAGAMLFDDAGKAYWDLLGGIAVNALGYRHPRLTKELADAAGSLLHVSNLFYDSAPGILAEKLVHASGLAKAFFCNSGTEANEAALKFARLKNQGRGEVVALHESFHGRTLGALSLTGHDAYREPFAPLIPGVVFVEPNDIDALAAAVTASTAAIFLEPVMGEGGIVPLTSEYLRAARKIADETGALLVLDEIQCGLGRTGTMFAYEQASIVPDMVTLAKALGGGLPLGAVLLASHVAAAVKPGHHGTTFGGNPLACRLGLAFLEEIDEGKLIERAGTLGTWLGDELSLLASETAAIIAVRGKGLMWGIELDRPAGPIAGKLLEKGFVVGTAREKVLRLLPPYIVPREALAQFVAALRQILASETAEEFKPVSSPSYVNSTEATQM